jgi:predicted transcriptional regulator
MASTTVRIDVEARERLRRLEERLGRSTVDTLSLAIDALDRQLAWDDVAAWYADHPSGDADDEAWVDSVARAQG